MTSTTTAPAVTRTEPVRDGAAPRRARLAAEQLLVVVGQGAAGLGNLAFALVAVHVLRPTEFASLATFLALYLLLFMPLASLSAGSSLDPVLENRLRRKTLVVGMAIAAGLATGATWIAGLLGMQPALVLVLAAAAPSAALLPLARGRLYGENALGGVVTTLVSEPAVRLTVGVGLTLTFGVLGGAVGVVAAGYAALALAYLAARRSSRGRAARPAAPRAGVGWAVLPFVLIAVVQSQDLVIAKGLLDPRQAALFAALSTLGGMAVFATATVPLVLMPRAAQRRHGALAAAVGTATVIGAGTVVGAAFAPPAWYGKVFGAGYLPIADLAVPYLGAMAAIGLARVLAAQQCARGRGRSVGLIALGGAALQAFLVVTRATDARGVAFATLEASAVLLVSMSVATFVGHRAEIRAAAAAHLAVPVAWWRTTAAVLGGFMVAATAIRLWIPRGLWLDEATSWVEATQPYHRMLSILRDSDVHPPGYLSVLWGAVRVLGQSELALRAPSIIAGVLLVPALYVAGRDLYDRRAGIVAAGLGVIAPAMVWYSQEARMYAFFQLFAVLAVWLQVLAVRRGRWWHWTGYALVSAAMLYTQYFTALVVVVQQLAFAVLLVRRVRRRQPLRRYLAGWLTSAALLAAAIVPLVPFAFAQFAHNQQAGKGFGAPPAAGGAASPLDYYTVVANLIWGVWGYHSDAAMQLLGALWPVGLLAILLLVGRGRSGPSTLLAAVGFLPMAALYVAGLDHRSVFDLRYFSALVPATVLLLARALTSWAASRVGRTFLAALVCASFLWGTLDEQVNHSNPRVYDFRGALHFVVEHGHRDARLLYAPADLNNLAAYYAPGLPARAASRAAVAAAGDDRIFVLASFLEQRSTQRRLAAVLPDLRRHRDLVATFKSANVRVWEFR